MDEEKSFILTTSRNIPDRLDKLHILDNYAYCVIGSHIERIDLTTDSRRYIEPIDDGKVFPIEGTLGKTVPLGSFLEVGDGRKLDAKFYDARVSDDLTPSYGRFIATLQTNYKISLYNEKLEYVFRIDNLYAKYVNETVAKNENFPHHLDFSAAAQSFPPGKHFPNESLLSAFHEMATLALSWSPVFPQSTASPHSALVLAIAGQSAFVTLFSVFLDESGKPVVNLIGSIRHNMDGFIHALAFSKRYGDNSCSVAIGSSSGAVKELSLRFEFLGNRLSFALEEERELLNSDQMIVSMIKYHPTLSTLLVVSKSLVFIVLSTSEPRGKAAVCAHDEMITSLDWLKSYKPPDVAKDSEAMDIDSATDAIADEKYLVTVSCDCQSKLWKYNGLIDLIAFINNDTATLKRPLYGVQISPNEIFAITFASPYTRVALESFDPPEKANPRLCFAPLEPLSIIDIIDRLLTKDGPEIVDWDLRKYVLLHRNPSRLLNDILNHLFSKVAEAPRNLRANSLLFGLWHFQLTKFGISASLEPMRETIAQIRMDQRIRYYCQCLEDFLKSLNAGGFQPSGTKVHSLAAMFAYLRQHKEKSASNSITPIVTKFWDLTRDLFDDNLLESFHFECPLCNSSFGLDDSGCQNNHPATVCERTLRLLSNGRIRRCIGCQAPSSLIADIDFPWIKSIPLHLCPLCDHRFHSLFDL